MAWTDSEIKILMARILGGNIDTGAGADEFITSGPASDQTGLEGDERIITRKINSLNSLIGLIDAAVNGFDDRFTTVVGNELGPDFAELGGNVISVLKAVKDQIEQGGGGVPIRFAHMQDTASAVWTISHNFNTQYVDVQIVDAAGNTCTADIEYTDANTVTLTFTVPITGTAIIRR